MQIKVHRCDDDTLPQLLGLPSQQIAPFISLLSSIGRVFSLDNQRFILNPSHLIEFIRPLVHHRPLSMWNARAPAECCVYCDDVGKHDELRGYLRDLGAKSGDAADGIIARLNRKLLPFVSSSMLPLRMSWSLIEDQTLQRAVLKLLQDCYIISPFLADADSFYVPARLLDFDEDDSFANDSASPECSCRLLFAFPTRSMPFLAALFCIMSSSCASFLHFTVSRTSVRVSKANSFCNIKVQTCHQCFIDLHGACRQLPNGLDGNSFPYILHVCANNFSLFAFAVQSIDKVLQRGIAGFRFESWVLLPASPSPIWGLLEAYKYSSIWNSSRSVPKFLSHVLRGKVTDELPLAQISRSARRFTIEEVFPRSCSVFLSHTSQGVNDGTIECVKLLKQELESLTFHSVWFDENDMGSTSNFYDKMLHGIVQCSLFIVALTPQYFLRPNCLIELDLALRLGKEIVVISMHPSVQFSAAHEFKNRSIYMRSSFATQRAQISRLSEYRLLPRVQALFDAVVLANNALDCFWSFCPWTSTSPCWKDVLSPHGGNAAAQTFREIVSAMCTQKGLYRDFAPAAAHHAFFCSPSDFEPQKVSGDSDLLMQRLFPRLQQDIIKKSLSQTDWERFYENLMNAAVWAISEDDIVEFAKTQGSASALGDWKKQTLEKFCMPRQLMVAIQCL
jgi:hypothetical protein